MKKTIIEEHVYEFTFRLVLPKPEDVNTLARRAQSLMVTQPPFNQMKLGTVSGRELCFDQDGGDVCLMTEGHRGMHEGVAGGRWGSDQ